jgi:hypothetical protein
MRSHVFMPALCLSAAFVAAAPAQRVEETRAYDVGAVVRARSNCHWVPAVAPLRAALALEFPANFDGEATPAADVDRLVALIGETTGGTASAQAEGRRIWVKGDAAAHAVTASLLASVRAACADEVVVRVALMSVAPPSAILAPAEAKRFFAENARSVEASAATSTDRAAFLRAGADVNAVVDYSVEVAQKAQIGDPVVRRIPLGLTARVAALALPDGRLLLRVGGMHAAWSAEPYSAPLGNKSLGDLQALRIDSSAVIGAAIVESGGAFVLGDGVGGGFWVAQATRTKAAPEASGTRAFIACEALFRGAGSIPRASVGAVHDSDAPDAESEKDHPSESCEPPTSSDFFIERLREMIWPAGERHDDERLELMGGKLFVQGAEAFQKRVKTAAVSFAATTISPVAFEARYGVVTPADAAALVDSGAKAEQLLTTRATISALAGESFRVMSGVERTLIADQDVEIAQEASIVDPVVETVFSGIRFNGRVERDENGSSTVSGEFLRQQDLSTPPFVTRLPESGGVEVVRLSRAIVDGSVSLSTDAWRLFGTATSADGVLVVMVRAIK